MCINNIQEAIRGLEILQTLIFRIAGMRRVGRFAFSNNDSDRSLRRADLKESMVYLRLFHFRCFQPKHQNIIDCFFFINNTGIYSIQRISTFQTLLSQILDAGLSPIGSEFVRDLEKNCVNRACLRINLKSIFLSDI